jgi:hypothetical protein
MSYSELPPSVVTLGDLATVAAVMDVLIPLVNGRQGGCKTICRWVREGAREMAVARSAS